jgi:TetR/AcrR family transcriptional repressor of bet genes
LNSVRSRESSKERRRLQLIRSTIDSIARRGFADTKMADVAVGAGLSTGIVNFYFKNKDTLLFETLRYLADEYQVSWKSALAKAGSTASERLRALVLCDIDPVVCNRKKIATWYAFWGEAKSRPTYLKICDSGDAEHHSVMRELCGEIIADGQYSGLDAVQIALGLEAITDGLWQDLLLDPKSFERARARGICETFLACVFPKHFTLPS